MTEFLYKCFSRLELFDIVIDRTCDIFRYIHLFAVLTSRNYRHLSILPNIINIKGHMDIDTYSHCLQVQFQ